MTARSRWMWVGYIARICLRKPQTNQPTKSLTKPEIVFFIVIRFNFLTLWSLGHTRGLTVCPVNVLRLSYMHG